MTAGDVWVGDADALAARIPDGARIAICKSANGVPSELIRRLVRRGARDLHVVCVPTGGYAVDLLIGAGCTRTVETSAVSLDEAGPAPRFVEAVKQGTITIMDSTCPAVYAGLRAAEKGIPFMPIRGLIGSDLMRVRKDYALVANPYAENDHLAVVPAIVPDFGLLHASMADAAGNVFVGADRDLALIAHASRQALVTVEERFAGDLLADPKLAAGTVSSLYISAVCVAEHGAWPLGLSARYDEDLVHMEAYREAAATREGFSRYLEEYAGLRAAV